ncbi:FctA domain-containing protein [Olsenella sp. YH-ols2217]|uniref:FctA domain-containing protein n=1 Tax=Kribbibacterium absianum TaxID=3044210 RepID=A0ABT6ZL58_9ACTN|nr:MULTISPECIES: FctA domain-containing protein [unclassified Olsenella]MDJ1122448.1 FctA domain-containing protein [Olsenella sp. YH-ols2216]MDJ1129298.1 FctA domain-containing protein [Olsenella sp. YH-ols2217]
MSNSIRNAWSDYINKRTTTVQVNDSRWETNEITLNHPTSDDITSLYYADGAYTAGTDDLGGVFANIIQRLQNTAFNPVTDTLGEGMTPLTYEDPIGEYMEVKGVTSVELFGEVYDEDDGVTYDSATGTVSLPNISLEHPVYKTPFSLSDIAIKVTEKDGKQTLTCTVPANVLPVRVETIDLDENDDQTNFTSNRDTNDARPLRLNYTVGFSSDVLTDGKVDLSKVSADYKVKHRQKDGSIAFYSNIYNSANVQDDKTAGAATATFAPSKDNRFYYFQANRPIYASGTEGVLGKDGSVPDQPLTTLDGWDDKATYYLVIDYHELGAEQQVNRVVARTGAELKKSVEVKGGQVVTKVHSPRLGNTHHFTQEKEAAGTISANPTGTAALAYAPTYQTSEGTTDYQIKAYLGNNGRVTVPTTGFSVRKALTMANGLTAPDQAFDFNLAVTNGTPGDVVVTQADGTSKTLTPTWNSGTTTVQLKAGETVFVETSPGAHWTVTETAPNTEGFSFEKAEGSSGTVTVDQNTRSAEGNATAGEVLTAIYTNSYTPEVEWPSADGSIPFTKTMTGNLASGQPRGFVAGDSFTFTLEANEGSPLPRAKDGDVTFEVNAVAVKVTAVNTDGTFNLEITTQGEGHSVTTTRANAGSFGAAFSPIVFDAPGTYTYTLSEARATASNVVAGVTYDGAKYTYMVTVAVDETDRTQLKVTHVQTDVANATDPNATAPSVADDGRVGPAAFTNSYDTDKVVRRFGVKKTLSGKPLEAGAFSFKVEAQGAHALTAGEVADLTGGVPSNEQAADYGYAEDSTQPMPASDTATNNASGAVDFDGIAFTAADASLAGDATDTDALSRGVVYKYQVSEVVPGDAVSNVKDGVTYDTTHHDVYVYCHVETIGGVSTVRSQVIYGHDHGTPDPTTGVGVIPFSNSYEAQGAATISGTKTIDGRTFREGDTFTFTLSEVVNGVEGQPILTKEVPDGQADKNSLDFSFDPIAYSQAGTHTYRVREVTPAAADRLSNMTYDTTVRTVTVTATDNGNGIIETAVDYGQGAIAAAFTNTYTPPTATVSLTGTKTFNGPITAQAFDFSTYQTGADFATAGVTPSPTWVNASTNTSTSDDGSVTSTATIPSLLPQASYGPGDYYFVIAENRDPDDNGVAYDETQYRVHLKVVDNFDGTATPTLTIKKVVNGTETDWNAETPLAFSNTYNGNTQSTANLSKVTLNTTVPGGGYQFELRIERLNADGTFDRLAKAGEAHMTDVTADDDGVYRGSSAADGSLPFGQIVFQQPGTYRTSLKEIVPEGDRIQLPNNHVIVNDVAYDTQEATRTYQVTRSGLGLTVNVADSNGFNFVNDGGIPVSKIVTAEGMDESLMPKGPFTFTVSGLGEDQSAYLVLDGKVTTLANESTFQLSANQTGRIYGLGQGGSVKLTEEKKDGFTPKAAELTASAVTGGAATPVAFENQYESKGSIDPEAAAKLNVTKTLTGRHMTAGQFTFTVAPADEASRARLAATELKSQAADTGKAAAAVTDDGKTLADLLGAVKFTQADAGKTFTWKVTENVPQTGVPAGYAYDDSEFTIKVAVKDNGNGTLTATPSVTKGDEAADAIGFTNRYSAASAQATLQVSKVLTGRAFAAGERFSFGLEAIDGAPMPAAGGEVTSVDTNLGQASFGSITYTQPGTYRYRITERAGNAPGVTYDPTVFIATVTVSDTGEGRLTATVTYNVENGATVTIPSFTNRYNSSGSMNGVASVNVFKTLAGRPMDAKQFSFTVTPADDASAAKVPTQTLYSLAADAGKREAAETADDQLLSEVFSKVTFTEADAGKTFAWTVAENAPAEDGSGYTYDRATHRVEIKVTDDGKGTLTAQTLVDDAVVDGGHAALVFNNAYQASSNPDAAEGSGRVTTTKTLLNRDLAAGEFAFVMRDAKGAEVARATNGADGTVDFGARTYTSSQAQDDVAAGVATMSRVDGKPVYHYTYTLVEDVSALPENVTAQQAVVSVTVNVTDNGDGTMTCDVVWPQNGQTGFVNAYEADPVQVQVAGTKVVAAPSGLSVPDGMAGAFTFTLADEGGQVIRTATNDASGTVAFDPISYTQEDLAGATERTFTYTVTEAGSVPGVSNEGGSKTVQVLVTQGADGHLSARMVGEPFSFTNTYGVEELTSSVTDQVSVTKVLSGRALQAGEFRFELVDPDSGNVVATGTNEADGRVTLSAVTYTEPGEHAYELREVAGDATGVTYDKRLATVTTRVTDNGKGKLEAVHSVSGGKAVFENTFTPVPYVDPAFGVGAKKVLMGRDWTDGDAFTFVAEAETEGAPMPDPVQVVATKDAPMGTFGAVTFTQPGTYSYLVRESAGDEKGMTYSKALYRVTYTIARDEATGELSGSKTVTLLKAHDGSEATGNADVMEFVNTYVKPTEPVVPDKPTGPDKPANPSKPKPVWSILPETGDALAALAPWLGAGGGVAALAAVAVLRGGRRKK